MLYRSLLRPLLFRLPAETAHELALHSLSIAPTFSRRLISEGYSKSPFGKLRRFGLTFSNPVGLAAGFDKDGIALEALSALGFGFIEAGTLTCRPQPGNERPRLFRLPMDQALINRAGFNNHGATAFAKRVAGHKPACVLGVSIGKNRDVPLDKAVEDYLKSFEIVYPVADYIAVNVSSPNTPGLRELQEASHLRELLTALGDRNQKLADKEGHQLLPVLVKLSPDLTDAELEKVVMVAQEAGVAGLIATNTTTDRSGLKTDPAKVKTLGQGGLSGAPLRSRATHVVARLHNLLGGSIPIIGVGGIFNANDAWQMISAGASLIQIYTGFIYEGPGIIRDINEGLRKIMSREGFVSFDEAVGCYAKDFI